MEKDIIKWDSVTFIEKKEISANKIISLFKYENENYISLDRVYPEIEDIQIDYKGIKFVENAVVSIDGATEKEITIINISDDRAANDFYKIICDAITMGISPIEKLELLKECLERAQGRLEELRGYVGEILYMLENPNSKKAYGKEFNGKRTELSYDIINGNNHIEVKSFHPSTRKIKMSLNQYMEKNIKVAIPVINDQNSEEAKNILELIEDFRERDFYFYNLVYKKYINNRSLWMKKWRITKPIDITSQIDSDFSWPPELDEETILCLKIDIEKISL